MSYRRMTDAECIEATKTWAAPGKKVRLIGEKETTTVHLVDNFYSPGCVHLTDRLGRMLWWNVDSLESAE